MTLLFLLQIAAMPFPWQLRRRLLNLSSRFKIARTAKVGLSLIDAGMTILDEGAQIGHLSIIKGLTNFQMHKNARVGNLNWITATPKGNSTFLFNATRNASLIIEREAAITHRHLIDCTDRVLVGQFAIVAGWRSQILTHSIDVKTNRQASAPISIGQYSFVGTACILLKGSSLPDFSILSAGSTLNSNHRDEWTLYSGCPASGVKQLSKESAYFWRDSGFVV